jgi:histidine triad (HIT) family protein
MPSSLPQEPSDALSSFQELFQKSQQANCLFCKIISGEIPAFRVYEDDAVIAFLDIKPVNPGHTLIVPKAHSEGFHDASEETLKQVAIVTQKVAKALVATLGVPAFNIMQNNGAVAGQVIPHLHLHVIPRHSDDGVKLWPGTPYAEGEIAAIQEKIKSALG